MSIKRRFENQYRNCLNVISNLTLPNWMCGSSFRVGLLLFIVLFGAGYLTRISALATSGYQLHDLENKISELNANIQKNQVRIAAYSSISSIESRLRGTNMVAVADIDHLSLGDALVAKR